MSRRLLTTPWSRSGMRALGIDPAALAKRVPEGVSLHVSARGPNGPWTVRAFIDGREVTKFDRSSGGFQDLGYGIDYVLELVRGVTNGG